jgi:hypothetical protein
VALVLATLVGLFVLWGAFDRVERMEQQDVPYDGRIAQATIGELASLNRVNASPVTIYLLDYPENLWPYRSAQNAIKAFYPNAKTNVVIGKSKEFAEPANSNTIVLQFEDGRVLKKTDLP